MWCLTFIDNLPQLGKTVLTRDCLHWAGLWACLGQYGWHHSLWKDFRPVWEWRNSAEHKQVGKHASFLTLWSWPRTWCDRLLEASALTSLAWQAGTVSWNKPLYPFSCLCCQTVSHSNGNDTTHYNWTPDPSLRPTCSREGVRSNTSRFRPLGGLGLLPDFAHHLLVPSLSITTSGCEDFWVLKGLISEVVGEVVMAGEVGWGDDGGPVAVGKD